MNVLSLIPEPFKPFPSLPPLSLFPPFPPSVSLSFGSYEHFDLRSKCANRVSISIGSIVDRSKIEGRYQIRATSIPTSACRSLLHSIQETLMCSPWCQQRGPWPGLHVPLPLLHSHPWRLRDTHVSPIHTIIAPARASQQPHKLPGRAAIALPRSRPGSL